jgi:hypothetical protein
MPLFRVHRGAAGRRMCRGAWHRSSLILRRSRGQRRRGSAIRDRAPDRSMIRFSHAGYARRTSLRAWSRWDVANGRCSLTRGACSICQGGSQVSKTRPPEFPVRSTGRDRVCAFLYGKAHRTRGAHQTSQEIGDLGHPSLYSGHVCLPTHDAYGSS